MRLYLIRHGIALDVGEKGVKTDEERPLSDEGKRKTAQVGSGLARLGVKPNRIVSSPLLRAMHTAEILAEETCPGTEVEACEALRPGGQATELLAFLRDEPAGAVLASGHMPTMSNIAGELIGARGGALLFKKAAVACVRFDGPPALDRGELEWLMQPAQLAALAKKGGKK